jgi:hypothetical protein
MKFKLATPALFVILAFCCKNPMPKATSTEFVRILEDTTGNKRAKQDLIQLKHYSNICKAVGIQPLSNGADSFAIRVWKQFSFFGMATDEEIYTLSIEDTTVRLTFYRVFCKDVNYESGNYKFWNPFTEPVVDSFFAVSRTFSSKITANFKLQNLWNLKTQSALHISDSIGFLDGSVNSIELASRSKYKLIRYHEAKGYYEKTGLEEIRRFVDEFQRLIILFQSNKVYE